MEQSTTTKKRKATVGTCSSSSDPESRKRSATMGLIEPPELPLELVCRVLAWVSVADLARGQLVCRQWRAIIAPPSPSASSADLWRRAYFNTWPLPACAGADATSSSSSSSSSATERGAVTGHGRRPELASIASKAARQGVDLRLRLDDLRQPDWRAVGLERLGLHAQERRHAPDVAEAVAQLRANMSRGVVDVLAALAPSIYYRRVHRRTTTLAKSGDDGGGGGVGQRLEDKEYAVDAVVYSATTGLPLHISLSYAWREDPSDRVPIFDDHVCPTVFFYAGEEPCEAVVRVPEDVESAPAVEDEFDLFLWTTVNVVEYLVGRAAGSERVTHVEVQDFFRALLNTGEADWVVSPDFLEPGARLPRPFIRRSG